MKTALLVIDVQAYNIQRAPKDLPGKIASHIQASNYDFAGFTVFRNIDNSNWEKTLNWNQCKFGRDLILANEFKGLANPSNIFEKNTYSALKQESLLSELNSRSIEEIHLCGIDTDACVLATAYDAFDQNYRNKYFSSYVLVVDI